MLPQAFLRLPLTLQGPSHWPSHFSLQNVKWFPVTACNTEDSLPPPPKSCPPSAKAPSSGAPPPWVTNCDKALLPVSGNSFPVSLLFHLSGAPWPSPIPQLCAPSCLPGSWLPPLFLRQHSLKISAPPCCLWRSGCHIILTC